MSQPRRASRRCSRLIHRRFKQQFDRIMRGAPPLVLFRVMAGNARAWEKFRAGSLLDRGPLIVAGARDRHRPHLRADRMRV